MRDFRDHREKQRFVIGAIVVLALIGIAAGVAGGGSVFGAIKAFFTPDGGTALFVVAVVLLNVVVWVVARWRGRRRKAAQTGV